MGWLEDYINQGKEMEEKYRADIMLPDVPNSAGEVPSEYLTGDEPGLPNAFDDASIANMSAGPLQDYQPPGPIDTNSFSLGGEVLNPQTPVDKEMIPMVDEGVAAAKEELKNIPNPRDVAKKYLSAKAQAPQPGAMEDALRLKAQTELLAGLGQAGGRAGAAISGIKPEPSFWDKMRSGAGYQADNERKTQEAKFKRDTLKEAKQGRLDQKKSETDRKELAKYGLARQGIGRGTAKIVGNLNKKRRTIRTIQGDLAAYRSGSRVLTPEQRVDLSTRISQVLTAGSPPLALIENTQFRTLGTAMASIGQKITNLPLNAYSDEQLAEIEKQMNDLEGANKMYWQELQADLWNTQAKELGRRNPGRAANHMPELTKHLSFDDDLNAIPLYQKDLKDKKSGYKDQAGWTPEKANRLAELRAKRDSKRAGGN